MFLYVIIVILILGASFLGLLDESGKNEKEVRGSSIYFYKLLTNVIVVLFMACLWYLTANRAEEIGNDTANYARYFLMLRDGMDFTISFELGFQLYCFLIGQLTSDPHVFFQITATLMYGGLTVYVFKYSRNLPFSLCLILCFCFPACVNELRQAFAMIIVMFAYQELKKGKTPFFIGLVFVASLFHKTALIALCFLLTGFVSLTPFIVVPICLLVAFLSISGLLSGILELFSGRYAHYFLGKYASSGWLAISFYVARSIIFYLLVFNAIDPAKRENKYTIMNFSMLLLLNCCGYSVNLFARLAEYFIFIAVSELPNSLTGGKIKHEKAWSGAIIAALLSYFIVTLVLRPEWNHLYPYMFWG